MKENEENRINALKSLQQQQIIIKNIEKNIDSQQIESIFPEFKKINSFYEEEKRKELDRVDSIKKTNVLLIKQEKDRKKKPEFRDEKRFWFWPTRSYMLCFLYSY